MTDERALPPALDLAAPLSAPVRPADDQAAAPSRDAAPRVIHRAVQGEHVFVLEAPPARDARASVRDLLDAYDRALAAAGLGPRTKVYERFYLSDIANQLALLPAAVRRDASCIEQAPALGGKIALAAYHVEEPRRAVAFSSQAGRPGAGAYQQSREIFDALAPALPGVVRTWVYLHDIDTNYAGMVQARREVFAANGLTPDTHYLASTGINGRPAAPRAIVQVDALTMPGLAAEQITYLAVPDHMPPTHRYGVTFERGTRLVHGDRAQFFISGTASIDREGQVLHHGDVRAQLRRSVENVAALLDAYGAGLPDVLFWLVYVRDYADAAVVDAFLREHHPRSACLILHAPICRPQWLVEVEAYAVTGAGDARFPAFAGGRG